MVGIVLGLIASSAAQTVDTSGAQHGTGSRADGGLATNEPDVANGDLDSGTGVVVPGPEPGEMSHASFGGEQSFGGFYCRFDEGFVSAIDVSAQGLAAAELWPDEPAEQRHYDDFAEDGSWSLVDAFASAPAQGLPDDLACGDVGAEGFGRSTLFFNPFAQPGSGDVFFDASVIGCGTGFAQQEATIAFTPTVDWTMECLLVVEPQTEGQPATPGTEMVVFNLQTPQGPYQWEWIDDGDGVSGDFEYQEYHGDFADPESLAEEHYWISWSTGGIAGEPVVMEMSAAIMTWGAGDVDGNGLFSPGDLLHQQAQLPGSEDFDADGSLGTGDAVVLDTMMVSGIGSPTDCADTNGDLFIDAADLNAILGAFGTFGPSPADVNIDEHVNTVDLNMILATFGTSCDS